MTLPWFAANPARSGRVGLWLAVSVLLGMIIIGLLSWLHFTQKQAFQAASQQMGELRQARIELTKGFLQASLAGRADAPFNFDGGLALLQQSIQTFEHTLNGLGMADSAEAAEFRHKVEGFRMLLADWQNASAGDARSLVAVRIAFADLERRTGRLDLLAHRHIEGLGSRGDRTFAWSLAGALLAMGFIFSLMLRLVRREQTAVEVQRQLDEAKRESEARLRILVNHAPLAMALFDRKMHYLAVSQSWLAFFDRVGQDVIGQSHYQIFPNLPEEWKEAHQRGLAGEVVGSDGDAFPHSDGTTVWARWEVRPWHAADGSVGGIVIFAEDITSRHDAQQALTEALEEQKAGHLAALNLMEDALAARQVAETTMREMAKLTMAVKQSPESIVITDLTGRIEYVNDAFVRITGYSPADAIGQNPRILRSGKTPPENYGALWSSLKHGQPWKGEFYNRRKDGSEYIEFAVVAPIRQPDGAITHYIAVKEDITEKKRLGSELDRYREHLGKR